METMKNFLCRAIHFIRGEDFVTKQKRAKRRDSVCITNYDERGSDVNSRLIEPRGIDSDTPSVSKLSAGDLDKRLNSCRNRRAIRLEDDQLQQQDPNQPLLLENFAYVGPFVHVKMGIFSVDEDLSAENCRREDGAEWPTISDSRLSTIIGPLTMPPTVSN